MNPDLPTLREKFAKADKEHRERILSTDTTWADFQKEISAQIKQLRKSAKAEAPSKKLFTLQSIADRMGISVPYLSDLERARRWWSPELFDKFITAFAEDQRLSREKNGNKE